MPLPNDLWMPNENFRKVCFQNSQKRCEIKKENTRQPIVFYFDSVYY